MTNFPATDLSAPIVTDSGTPLATNTAYEDSLWAPLGRLRTAARTAGLHLPLGYPDDTPGGGRLPLGSADEPTVRQLASLLAAAGTTPQPAPETPGIDAAAAWLRTCAQAAGVELHLGTPGPGSDGREMLPLGDAGHGTVTRLAEVLEAGTFSLIALAESLRSALAKHGIQAEHTTAEAGTVAIGEISVHDGCTLSLVLDRRRNKYTRVDPDHQYTAEKLADQITDVVRAATGGGFVDAAYLPYCRRCGGESAILLRNLEPRFVQPLITRLNTKAAA
ncbi:hypothetical protein [Streptomyces sp. CA-111067]|uniref:hypothetical protein n=1 Tax=Streptomyces sp. CA-111067 TaxID=3240046 RepID=UPI003D98C417